VARRPLYDHKKIDHVTWVGQFDGGIRGGNPGGLPTYGVSFTWKDQIIHEIYGVVTADLPATNNVAEWTGMKVLLMTAWMFRHDWGKLIVCGDSQLVIKQLTGEYQVNSDHLKPIHGACIRIYEGLRHGGNTVEFKWNRRDKNERADELAGRAYDEYSGNNTEVKK
jgi:ribonuclease HI